VGSNRTVDGPRRGEVHLVDFDPTRGAEIRKVRPALVIQNDVANRFSQVTIVAAITSRRKPPIYATEVLVAKGDGGLQVESIIVLNQLRTVDRSRLLRRVGMMSGATMSRVDQALLISLGLVEF
jgi:mRNA interferase MazF